MLVLLAMKQYRRYDSFEKSAAGFHVLVTNYCYSRSVAPQALARPGQLHRKEAPGGAPRLG